MGLVKIVKYSVKNVKNCQKRSKIVKCSEMVKIIRNLVKIVTKGVKIVREKQLNYLSSSTVFPQVGPIPLQTENCREMSMYVDSREGWKLFLPPNPSFCRKPTL